MAVQSISIPPQLAYVLDRAGDKSGVDFDYLLQTAIRESSLDPAARARTSTATGLFQFLESTWLDVMKSDGPRLGYDRYASAINRTGDGDYDIADPRLKAEVLKLREDPETAADMAAAFTRRNGEYLSRKFGRMPSPGELYIAHFLGAEGAERLFRAGMADPDQVAADLFPRPAKANPSIFYEDGRPRTIRQVYQALVARHAGGPAAPAASAAFAAQQLSGASEPVVPVQVPVMSFRSLYATGTPQSAVSPVAPAATPSSSFFSDLYRR